MSRLIDLTGQTFGRWRVECRAPRNGKYGQPLWVCTCICGSTDTIYGHSLRTGHTTSCGCFQRERCTVTNTRHGYASRSEYIIYRGILQRCYNPKCRAFHNYGGRGIKVCDRWLVGENGFKNFIADVGDRPSSEHSLDRFPDNDGDYEPNNVRWATRMEQAHNRRSDMDRIRILELERVSGLPIKQLIQQFKGVPCST